MSFLWGFLPGTGGSSGVIAQPKESKQLDEAQLHELHAQWLKLQANHATEAEGLLARLVEENSELKVRLEETARELRDVKAGRKEDEIELKRVRTTLESLGGEKHALAVAILDFETDIFAPAILQSTKPGQTACRELQRKMIETLPPESQGKTVQFLIYIFWSKNAAFAKRLVDSGVFRTASEIDNFISELNQTHPLCMFISSDSSRESVLQRQRALATVYGLNPTCHLLLLGRWALDLPLAEMLAPSHSGSLFPAKVRFLEPLLGFFLTPELKRRGLQIVGVPGLFRRYPLQPSNGKREIDYDKPLWKQTPPLCLDHHLAKCLDERCRFSHAYHLPPPVLDSLTYDLSTTPCPLVLSGDGCLDQENCFFAHRCPRERCDGRYCDFKAPGMHPSRDTQPRFVALPPSPAQHPPFPSPIRQNSLPHIHIQRHHWTDPQRTIPPSPPLQAIRQKSLPIFPPKRDRLADLTPLPARHPLSPSVAPSHKDKSSTKYLSDGELRALLEKTKREEEEYEKGMKEDPFYQTGRGINPMHRQGGKVI